MIKSLAYFFLVVLIVLTLILIRYPYILKALQMAFRSGRLGPAISEKEQFANRMIHAHFPQPWIKHKGYNQVEMKPGHLANQEALGSAAFLVWYADEMIYERYWHPFHERSVINSFSIAKSVVSILIGIAEFEGLLKTSDAVAKYLPEFGDERRNITIEHLLMMSSGLDWVESEGNPISHNAKAYYGRDLHGLISRLRSRRPPGEVFRYASGNTQILAMLLNKVTGQFISEYAEHSLWSKIGATHSAYWNLDHPDGIEKAFCCLYATPRDFGRLGKLYRDRGSWNGKPLLAPSYVERSLQPVGIHDVWRNCPNDIYGWHWWVANYQGGSYFYARGIRGQYIICNPEADIIIVRMGQNRNPVERHSGHPPDLFDHIDAGLEIIYSNPAIAPA